MKPYLLHVSAPLVNKVFMNLNTGVHNFEVCVEQSGSGTHVGMIAVFHADV